MSRGFVKEDDQEEAPFIPPRAALPAGVINYVTPKGYEELLEEKKDLEHSLSNLNIENDKEKRHASAVLNGKLNLLNERISSARILDPGNQPPDEVRFGATVTFEILKGEQRGVQKKFQIVGIDEADIRKKKIAFVAPIARVLTGKRIGDEAVFSLGAEKQDLEIIKIKY